MPLTRREFLKAVAILTGTAMLAPDAAAWLGDGGVVTAENLSSGDLLTSDLSSGYYPVNEFWINLDGKYISVETIAVSFSMPRTQPVDDGDNYLDFLLRNPSPYWEACITTTDEPLSILGHTKLARPIEVQFLLDDTVIMFGDCCIVSISQEYIGVANTIVIAGDMPLTMEVA